MGAAIQSNDEVAETAPIYAPKRAPANVAAPLSLTHADPQAEVSNEKLKYTNPLKEKSLVEGKTNGIVRPFGSTGNQNIPEVEPHSPRSVFAP